MKKLSLSNTGLSMSQAQSVSNILNQRVLQLSQKIKTFNTFSSTIKVNGDTHSLVKAKPIPKNIKDILEEIGILSGVQAFLMENIKGKEEMLNILKSKKFSYKITPPKKPEEVNVDFHYYTEEENFGWEQLTLNEINEYYKVEALAAHYGQFIHKNGILDNLRKNINDIPEIEWFEVKKDEKTPVENKLHHTSEELLAIHEEIAKAHREAEQRVNYFKAKVKNLVSAENARISKVNSIEQARVNVINSKLRANYAIEYNNYLDLMNIASSKFEEDRHMNIKELASFRILVPDLFKPVVDDVLAKIEKEGSMPSEEA